jgi:hypothetical protein
MFSMSLTHYVPEADPKKAQSLMKLSLSADPGGTKRSDGILHPVSVACNLCLQGDCRFMVAKTLSVAI